MDPSTSHDELKDIQATLARLDALVETSRFEDERERSALRQQLGELQQEVGGLNEETVPTSLKEALQQTEGLAIRRLTDWSDDDDRSDNTSVSWGRSIEQAIQEWEAQHPRLSVALMKFSDVLSKLGI